MTLSDYHLHWLLFSENWWHMTLEYCRHFNIKLTLGKNCDPLITSNEWMMHLYGHPFFLRDFDYTANWFLMVRLFLGWERRKLYYKTFLSVLKKKGRMVWTFKEMLKHYQFNPLCLSLSRTLLRSHLVFRS